MCFTIDRVTPSTGSLFLSTNHPTSKRVFPRNNALSTDKRGSNYSYDRSEIDEPAIKPTKALKTIECPL
jgi:hypothetical protein